MSRAARRGAWCVAFAGAICNVHAQERSTPGAPPAALVNEQLPTQVVAPTAVNLDDQRSSTRSIAPIPQDQTQSRSVPSSVGNAASADSAHPSNGAMSSAPPPAATKPQDKSKAQKSTSTGSFDMETLKRRGIDPKLAEYFRDAPRFTPGVRQVTLYVNGDRRGLVDATFDAEGQLCFNRILLDRAGLVLPAGAEGLAVAADALDSVPNSSDKEKLGSDKLLPSRVLEDLHGPVTAWAVKSGGGSSTGESSVEQGTCFDMLTAYPQAEVALRPGVEEIRLVVPSEALRPTHQDFTGYSTGGIAGLVNYDFLSTNTQSDGSNTRYRSLNMENGLNIGDWSVRSRQSLVDLNGDRTTENLYAFAEHSLVGMQSLIQVGQVNIVSPVFSGAAITGVQLLPDGALRPKSKGGVTVSGIAQTSQARVEVTQNGILIHSTVVPTGPFTLRDIALLQGNADVVVTVFESDGSQHSDRIAAASLRTVELVPEGFSIAAGQVRSIGDSGSETPSVVTLSDGWLVGESSVLAAGLMFTPDYRAIGWDLGTEFTRDISVSLTSLASQDSARGESGMQNSVTLNTRLSETVTLGAAASRRSQGYLDLSDSTQSDQDQIDLLDDSDDIDDRDFIGQERTEYSLNLGWNAREWGAGTLSFFQSKEGGGETSRSVAASWGTRIGSASVNANFRHELDDEDGNSVYLSISLPLGRSRSVRAFSSRNNDRGQVGTTYNETVSDTVSYSLSATKSDEDDGAGLGGTLSALPRYAQVNLGYNEDDTGSNSNLGISGGLVVHSKGITASPYAVHDTFAVAAVGDMGGIKLSTPSGPVWTDAGGRAVVAQLPAFGSGSVEVVTNTLPRNVDLENGYKSIDAGRGSVSYVDFGVVTVRRVLLSAVDAAGQPLPKGASVVDAQERFITTVVDGGKIFLVDATQKGLVVSLPDGSRCALTFQLPEKVDIEVHFEQLDAQCRAL
ncbi:fimbria/pilus outer membrane usher protein [Pseudomonas resinovorans]|uniref:Fimbria/pilus outer membrane usher protein n=2 Tax=Metapseudomonas resinovorans TaxID=53412 RepID=A0ABT4YAA3_METRE|nr:fimbria/pilus outer membrane usher protein [Pseudomonas resinovorans]